MSQYLVDCIQANPGIELHARTEMERLKDDHIGLTGVVWRTGDDHQEVELATRYLFLIVGAVPNTTWLHGCDLKLDRHGFVCTGAKLGDEALADERWVDRQPRPLECSIPGVFAIGDVRSGSVKRVARAVGEGAAVVAQLHAHLLDQDHQTTLATP